MDLDSNLKPLKYSLDLFRIGEIRKGLGKVGEFDAKFYASYDKLTSDLDQLAFEIESGLTTNKRDEARATARQAYQRILIFEDELNTSIADMRDVKNRILHGRGGGGSLQS